MDSKKRIILNELERVAKILNKQRFTRKEFTTNSQISISVNDIEEIFGGFSNLMLEAGFRPQKHHKISDEKLFEAYAKAYNELGHYPLGHLGETELAKITKISGGVFRKRFRGLKNFLFEFKNWELGKSSGIKKITISDEVKVLDNITIAKTEVATETFENKARYIGKATENLVVAELLFRGFNAQILQVDEGIDIFATNLRKNELYLIQAKHASYENINRSRSISITVSSFERNKKSNVFYIFVLEPEINIRNFLILPFYKLDELMKNGAINKTNTSRQFSFSILHKSKEDAFIGTIANPTDVSRYLNAWDVLL